MKPASRLLLVAIAIGLLIGWLFGGPDRAVSMRGAAITAALMAGLTFVDRVMQGWRIYSDASIYDIRLCVIWVIGLHQTPYCVLL